MKELRCDATGCPNNKGFCYKVDNVHLKVFPTQLTSWSMEINVDEDAKENPSVELVRSFQPAKSNQVNPLRDPVQKINNAHRPPHDHGNIPGQYPQPFPMQYPNYYHQYGLPVHNTQYLHMAVPPDTHAKVDMEIRSSSVNSGEDGSEKLIEYLDWLARKTPKLASKFNKAKEELIERDYMFDDLKALSDATFDKMGISEGIGHSIRTQGSKFTKYKAKRGI
jgi:hypothetical protein